MDKAAPTLEALKWGALNKMEAREMLDHDAISEFEDDKEDIPLIAIEKAKAEAVGEQQRKTQKEAPKPTPSFGGGVTGTAGGSKPSTTATKVRDATKSQTKVSQDTSQSR